MKSANQLRTEVQNFIDLALHHEIAIYANQVVCVPLRTGQRVTWQPPSNVVPILTDPEFATIEEYLSLLRIQAYSLVLSDGALMQLSYDVNRNHLIGHRLCYYPCPVDIDNEELLENPIADIVETYISSGSSALRLRSPIRFDYDPKNAREGHPVTHAHLLWNHCRCSMTAPISLGYFVKFIFKNFYPEVWDTFGFIEEWQEWMPARTITNAEETQIHFACRRA